VIDGLQSFETTVNQITLFKLLCLYRTYIIVSAQIWPRTGFLSETNLTNQGMKQKQNEHVWLIPTLGGTAGRY
jgi:hypothetical protein